MLLLIYNYAFGNSLGGDYGKATALSLMLAGFLAVFSLVYLRATRSWSTAMSKSLVAEQRPDLASRLAQAGGPLGRRRAAQVAPARAGWSSSGSARSSGSRSRRSRRRIDTITASDGALPARRGLEQPAARPGSNVHVGRYFWNTVVLAFGSWLVADRRRDHRRLRALGAAATVRKVITGCCSRRCSFPAVVLLVPLYIEIVHPPLIHHSFIDSYWAIWLPAGASAFNVMLVKRFFDNLPREIFEAARVDGAGPSGSSVDRAADVEADPRRRLGLRRARVVEGLPLAAARAHEPRQAAALGAPAGDPVADGARRLPGGDVHRLLVPIVGFLIFQRSFLRGSGLGGAIKG